MNNLPDDRTRLLAATLEGEWTTGPAAAMALRAAAHARHRRAIKRATLTLAVSAAAIAAVVISRRTRHRPRPQRSFVRQRRPPPLRVMK